MKTDVIAQISQRIIPVEASAVAMGAAAPSITSPSPAFTVHLAQRMSTDPLQQAHPRTDVLKSSASIMPAISPVNASDSFHTVLEDNVYTPSSAERGVALRLI